LCLTAAGRRRTVAERDTAFRRPLCAPVPPGAPRGYRCLPWVAGFQEE